jgi:hypothetical protein
MRRFIIQHYGSKALWTLGKVDKDKAKVMALSTLRSINGSNRDILRLAAT